ncbi:hypothetical protein E4U55_005938 [Claviceps digitariae]|nr:hypothetical protein E4U55_005938 [Claviceps digitariae]
MAGGNEEEKIQFGIRAKENEQTTFAFIMALIALGLVFTAFHSIRQVCGYAAVAHTIVHGSCYSYYFVKADISGLLVRPSDIMGIVAGVCWFLLALTGIFVRRWWYELFYYLHIILWMVSIVAIGFHQPHLGKKVAIGTVVAGSMWGLDRLIRFVRLMLYTVNNSATLIPLPNGGTRVILAKPPLIAKPGEHAFLWIPHIRLLQTHPFTIVSADPLEFVIASRDGFTGALHKYATANPGVCLKASIEGSYGTVPDPSAFETAVLVAGGSGASFIFGLARALSQKIARTQVMTRKVVFVWVVKHRDQLEWFSDHLTTLGDDPLFSIQVFVTRSSPPASRPRLLKTEIVEDGNDEKSMMKDLAPSKSEMPETSHTSSSQSSVDLEKSLARSDSDFTLASDTSHAVDLRNTVVKYERPNIDELIREAVGDTAAHERILVSGCGPAKLMDVMRETTADCIRSDGPSIELHCEKFGW